MCSHTTARSGIIIILLGFIMQFLQYLLSDVTDALTVDQQIPVVRAKFWPRWTCLKSLRNLDKNTNILSAKSIYLACVCWYLWVYIVRLSCCQSAVSGCLSRRKYLWKTWMTKTRWGFCASLCGGELMQRHYPFFFVLVFPTLYKEKDGEGEGLLEKNTRHDRATVTGGSITTPSL